MTVSRVWACALLVSMSLAAPGCGDDEEQPASTSTPTATATPTPTETATATPTPTATATAVEQPAVLWPEGGAGEPAAAAESFVTDFIGVENPALGEFREAEPRVGEIDVFRSGEDGRKLEPETTVATIHLRQLGGPEWFVTTVSSELVVVGSPEAYDTISSPVTIKGKGRGFEGNVVLEVREAFATEALAKKPVIAGSMGDLEPFTVKLTFEATGPGAVVALTGSGISAADGFAAFPVTLE